MRRNLQLASKVLLSFQVLLMALNCQAFQSAAHCPQPLARQEDMLKALNQSSSQSPQLNFAVGGLQLKQENQRLIDSYRYLTTYKDTKLNPAYNGDIDFYSLFKDSSCHSALCASEKIFGKEKGLLYLFYASEYGINLSHLGYDRVKLPDPRYALEFKAWYTVREWNLQELTPILQAVHNLPKKRRPLPFTRVLHSGIINPKQASIIANGLVTFYMPFDRLSSKEKEKVAYHELGHNVASANQLDISNEWLEAAGWSVQGDKVINLRPEEFVSDYTEFKNDCFEDFAETFMYYRYEPELLLKKSPKRYNYMKNYVYDGEEFLKDSACR